MALKDSSAGAFIKGVDASTGLLTQPRGSVPRGSNLILTKRGALQTCDGTAITNAYNGAVTPNWGKILCIQLFAPVGVTPYPLLIATPSGPNALQIAPPQNLVATDGGTGGLLAAGQYFYLVTAYDGQGETTGSNEVAITVAANHLVNLTWNIAPNAIGYRIYRTPVNGGPNAYLMPQIVLQPAPGTLTASFTDVGFATTSTIGPSTNTTGQTALFSLQQGNYTDSNILALFPSANGAPSGPNGTPSGGIVGSVSNIPQMLQFVNQMVVALGNGVPPQLVSDAGSPDNRATVSSTTGGSIDAYGVVTINTQFPHNLSVGATVTITGAGAYNGLYTVINVPSPTQFQVRNVAAIGAGPVPAGGTVVAYVQPIQSLFASVFPAWAAKTQYVTGNVVVPTTANGYYYKVISPAAGGLSGTNAPSWPSVVGATVQDSNITWQCAGTTASAAPPPPGAAHIAIYANALWVWDTWPNNTSNGLDGPTCLRMSDVGNPNSWNPVNQAFLDKDDGTEGMGLAVFTITAQGIPPEGSMIAAKNYATYQIVGVFGASNFAIQRATTDMGCISPRTLEFIPGYGIGRISHLGVCVFDGVNDRLISPQVEPYLFYNNDPELSDIVPADSAWLPYAWSAQTSYPAMYCIWIPLGMPLASQGRLTRALCFDMVLRAWGIVDFPFDISCVNQYYANAQRTLNTFVASYSDSTVQRWQAQDTQWATAASGVNTPAPVIGVVRSASVASKDPDQRVYARRVVLTGQIGYGPVASLLAQPRASGVILRSQTVAIPKAGSEFAAEACIDFTSSRFDVIVTFSGDVTLNDIGISVDAKPIGVLISSFG